MVNLFSDDLDAGILLSGGIAKAAAAAAPTFGPLGRSAVCSAPGKRPDVMSGGAEILARIQLDNPFEQMGARLLQEAVERTIALAGDGGTATAILTKALAAEICRCRAAGLDATALNRGMTAGVNLALKALYQLAEPAEDGAVLEAAASAAARDQTMGPLIGEALTSAAHNAAISVAESLSPAHSIVKSAGMRLERGYLSTQLTADGSGGAHTLSGPHILITNQALTDPRALLPILEETAAAGTPLLLIVEDLSPEVMAMLIANNRAKALRCTAVQAPEFGARRLELLCDMAALTGAAVIAPELGIPLEEMRFKHLGRASRVMVDADAAVIVQDNRPASASERLAALRRQLDQTDFPEGRRRLQRRIADLTGGGVTLLAGGVTPVEAKENCRLMERGLRAAQSSRCFGVAPGGGVTYIHMAGAVTAQSASERDPAVRAGLRMTAAALSAPLIQLAENCGADGSCICEKVRRSAQSGWGLDVVSGQYRNLRELGIWDSAQVLDLSLRHAASVGRMLLSAGRLAVEAQSNSPGFYQKFKSVDMFRLHQAYGKNA